MLARGAAAAATDTIKSLRRQLQSLCLGFASLRAQSHVKLLAIWNEPRTSSADGGQNAAGGAQKHKRGAGLFTRRLGYGGKALPRLTPPLSSSAGMEWARPGLRSIGWWIQRPSSLSFWSRRPRLRRR
jgi:hypothetical protein